MHKLAEFIHTDASNTCRGLDLAALRGARVLVTGASGLLGTYFVTALSTATAALGLGTRIIAVTQSSPLPYFRELLDSPFTECITGDLTTESFCRALPEADFVIHAAGYGQPAKFLANPVKTIQLNTTATVSLSTRLRPGGRFLFLSTSELYSGLARTPCREEDIGTTTPDHPRGCYIEAKRCGEAICHALRKLGVTATIARVALAYGPGARSDDTRVLNHIVRKALDGNISLLDAGTAKRTYCYVTDAVELMLSMILKGNAAVYNVGGRSRTTIAELAETVGRYLHVPVSYPVTDSRLAGAPDDVCLDMSAAENEFGKHRYVSMEDGLARTIEWQRILLGK